MKKIFFNIQDDQVGETDNIGEEHPYQFNIEIVNGEAISFVDPDEAQKAN